MTSSVALCTISVAFCTSSEALCAQPDQEAGKYAAMSQYLGQRLERWRGEKDDGDTRFGLTALDSLAVTLTRLRD